MKNEPKTCCEECRTEAKVNGMPFCRYPTSCSCHHPTLAQLSEEIEKQWEDHFRGFYNAAAIRGIDVGWEQHKKFIRAALKKVAVATYDAVKVEEREVQELDLKLGGHLKWYDWNEAKAEVDRNFTSFMGENV